MFEYLIPNELNCDAPPYEVVRACEEYGFYTPLDVRWLRRDRVPLLPSPAVFHLDWWRGLLGMSGSRGPACSCGRRLPVLREYLFPDHPEGKTGYLLGQCPRCDTVYWDEI